ncbi:MAG TPA: aldehyde dehydrogenase family protein, partial [Pirellulaceae bacterium]|nr:aldehyde dehydrogenase family protein [Pirellulaceae bacterium]
MSMAKTDTGLRSEVLEILGNLGVPESLPANGDGRSWRDGCGEMINDESPIDGCSIAEFPGSNEADLARAVARAEAAFHEWRLVPAPQRGQYVRAVGEALREAKSDLARLIAIENGKILPEAEGEVQEMIDICEFAVGLSRQLYGLTIASERPAHRLTEYWHPLGVVGVISAFNFPAAVWSWNAMLALVCGDAVVWKPSEKTPLTAMACHALAASVARSFGQVPDGLVQLVQGGATLGQSLARDRRVSLLSATGSTQMGRMVGPVVAARFGRCLLELGGNNAAIVAPTADLDLVRRAVLFSAVGTCGQRCTTMRRLIVHESIAENVLHQLQKAYAQLPIGNPLRSGTLVGPLIDRAAFETMQEALQQGRDAGGRVFGGERITNELPAGGYYVQPALVEIDLAAPVVKQETFAPILYCGTYRELHDAMAIQNGVPQGLSSSIFTNDVREAEWFCSAAGSDCGIANVNLGTSGAEIGGAFGGEKETGGGRESGSDAWKNYMRRMT